MSIWDKPNQADGSIKDLTAPFQLISVATREVKTRYGINTAVDLTVRTESGDKVYSGFSAGIAAQIARSVAADFPCWARIETVPLSGGRSTTQLVPEQEQIPLPNAGDDDIPF